jgi:rhamnulokinase
VLGLPFHYRDDAHRRDVERAFERVPAEAVRGDRHPDDADQHRLPAARRRGPARCEAAQRIALVPDLLALWLCGELANERTNASTTGLLDARSGEWARADRAARAAGAPVRPLVEPGTSSARCSAHHELGDAPVYAVAATTPRRRSPPRRSTSTRRCSPAARGRCSGSSCRSPC